jgi:hypothetical protein
MFVIFVLFFTIIWFFYPKKSTKPTAILHFNLEYFMNTDVKMIGM